MYVLLKSGSCRYGNLYISYFFFHCETYLCNCAATMQPLMYNMRCAGRSPCLAGGKKCIHNIVFTECIFRWYGSTRISIALQNFSLRILIAARSPGLVPSGITNKFSNKTFSIGLVLGSIC